MEAESSPIMPTSIVATPESVPAVVDTRFAHWLLAAARDSGLLRGDAPVLDPAAAIVDLWRAIARAAGVPQTRLAAAVAESRHLPLADLTTIQARAVALIPEKLARARHLIGLRESDHEIVVAAADPLDMEAEHLVGFVTGRRPVLEVAPPDAIHDLIDAHYAPDRAIERLLGSVGSSLANAVHVEPELGPEQVAARDAASAPIMRLTSLILRDAVHARASDIHIEPEREGGRVRFRVDGVLQPYTRLSLPILNRVVSRIKIRGRMDIADRLRPQDGRARIRVDDRSIDLRLSTVPTRESEKAVIRLLDPRNARRLEDLSLEHREVEALRGLLGHRDSIVLVTGPTGSGKTTLLYAALREMPTGELNVMTVEDPVEYELPGLTQIQVEPKRDVTFANALRSILRQDPDVIFIGEIRDAETAAIAVQASLTGHLVLASLHTNDAVGAVGRFADLGVERGAIASTLRGATAQRLVRRVCPRCAQRIGATPTPVEQRLALRYGVAPVMRAIGCAGCNHTGYYGRIPLLEVMVASPALEAAILDGAPASRLQAAAVAGGMRPLHDAAAARVRAGETTLDEIDRELGEADAPAREPEPPAHVLVVDDDAVSRTLAGSVLRSQGMLVSEAADGAEALGRIEAGPAVSLVVLDLSMPGLDGIEVLHRLRSRVATSLLPVVVVTGATDVETEVRSMDAGADDYVRKPLDAERFLARIRATLRRAEH
jgi:type II secretory ATPase GspE/PulE/Tfp pilus assembly ATPase PilB-like protein/ActR/RegA family two-component response regulator